MKKFKIALTILCIAVIAMGLIYRNNRNEKRDYEGPKLSAENDTIEVGINAADEELMTGVTAMDDVDGDVTKNIIIEKIEKSVDGEDNEFMITYVCFDSSGNIGRLKRQLVYTDYEKPHFSLNNEMRFPLNTTVNLFDYVTAEDSLDGNISPFITIDGTKELGQVTNAGNYFFNLSVTNSVGDTATLPIQVELYEDSYEEQAFRPRMYLTDYLVYIDKGTKFKPEEYLDYIDDGGRCLIQLDGEEVSDEDDGTARIRRIPISDIKIESSVDTKKEGVYTVVYKYTSQDNGYDSSTRLIVVVE